MVISGAVWLGCSDDDDDKPQEVQEVYRGSCQASVTARGSTLNLNCFNVFSKDELTEAELCPRQQLATVAKANDKCSGTLEGSCSFSANGKNIRQDHYGLRTLSIGDMNINLAQVTAGACQGAPVNGTWTAAQ